MRAFISIDSSITSNLKKIQSDILKTTNLSSNILKPVKEQNFHFTLLFLGETSLDIINQVKSKLSEISFNQIDINYQGIGVFPSFNFPKIIWLGVSKESELELCKIFDMVYYKLKNLGFRQEKKYTPHLTLFRIKNQVQELSNIQNDLEKYKDKHFGKEIINSIHLKQSELGSEGPNYSKLYTIYSQVS
ncbi:MAG: RNA 2',3'-cyclic phosphodiesterase [Nitrososphaeraceae archaeon]